MKKSWLLVCFINFFVAATMGLLLRLMYLIPISGINYQFLVHGHSHVALLGWTYLAISCLIIHYFLPKTSQEKPVFTRLFWTTEIAIVGMMVDFPIQGYAVISIFFSTLHIFCSYFFAYLVWRETKNTHSADKALLDSALLFMLFSTLGVWCLGPAVGLMGKASAFYQIAIQFFLHFQFNGWFLFAIVALLLKISNSKIDKNYFNWFHYSFILGTLLTFSLPVSWYLPHPALYYINSIGVCFLYAALYFFIKMHSKSIGTYFSSTSTIEKNMYRIAFFSLVLKILLQGIVLNPELSDKIHLIRPFVIGYIHLSMLGILTFFIFGFLSKSRFLDWNTTMNKWGIGFIGIGFCTTEVLLLFQGITQLLQNGSFPFYSQLLFTLSVFLPLGLLSIAIAYYLHQIKPS